MMISLEFSEGITETLDILNHMDKSYTDKIPKKFKDFLEKNKLDSYIPHLDHSKKIKEMNLKEKTKDILATIYMNYWCNSEQKEDYIRRLKQNEERFQENLREKYNPNDIFKDKKIETDKDTTNTVEIVEYKESIIKRIIRKIKNIFTKK